MQRQGGNFLLQALLALALIIAFIPFFTQKLLTRDKDSQMYAVSNQVETAQTAARIYLRENFDSIKYETTTISGDAFSDTLEPYGLPLGFVPRTILGQKISLITYKTEDLTYAYLELVGGNLSQLQRAELVKRLGFYASEQDGNIYIIIPLDEIFSNIVKRKESNINENGFLSDLDMGGFGIENIGSLLARNGEFESIQTNTFSLFGIESGRKIRSTIENLTTAKSVFQSNAGETALSITRGVLNLGNLSAKTISKFGDTGNLVADSASVYDFSMTAGRTSFTGPAKWNVKGNLISDKINFNIERLEISSLINASRGQDVFVNPDSLEYSSKSGIEVGDIYAQNITLRDQTSYALANGETGAVVLDIRPAGTSVLPDVLIDNINNDNFKIISNPSAEDSTTVDCKSIINSLNGTYNSKSLSQNIICQYVFWQRLEKRIDIKKCILDGGSDCE
ncbi:MAG: hypothetical protein JW974_03410 [Alphaproteobacteria bacterium]|nr:hypothetical protein [Alphaproteobacteria bacterium]MBN2675286.1 hypothetical protein [Alphaproteobacteria bacterium]